MNALRAMGGFTLMELMVGMSVGVILLSAVGTTYLTTFQGNLDVLQGLRLNQALRETVTIMANDLRRAGYSASPAEADFTAIATPSAGCILYSYDVDGDAATTRSVEEGDRFGFRLKQRAIWMRSSGTDMGTCNGGNWERLTDPADVQITSLEFTLRAKCVNADTGERWSSGCADEAHPGYGPPNAGDRLVEVRHVHIAATGRLAATSAISQSVATSVKIRNDRVLSSP